MTDGDDCARALLAGGSVECFGTDDHHQLGDPSFNSLFSLSPPAVAGIG